MLQLIDKYGNVYGEGPIIVTTKDGKLKTNVTATTAWGSITGILSNQTDLQATLNAKQATLVSGTNIKTINGSSILGSGNLVITGGVSSVSGVAPIASSGGATPSISIATADGSTTGALTFTDWNTFNNKENAIAPGTISQYWRGDKTWQTFPTIPTVNPSALTKTDDTNVTLTLGGSPSNALLQGVSLTLGWTGTLADSRIASASTWNAKQNALTLTTTGSSGAATLSGATLNIPQYGGGGGGFHLPIKPRTGAGYSNNTIIGVGTFGNSGGILYLTPFIPANTLTITSAAIQVTNVGAGTNMKIVIYSDVNGLPTTKLLESSLLDISTTGFKTFTTSFTFNASTTYWIGTIASLGAGATASHSQTLAIGVNTASNVTFNSFSIGGINLASIPTTLSLTSANLASIGSLPRVTFVSA